MMQDPALQTGSETGFSDKVFTFGVYFNLYLKLFGRRKSGRSRQAFTLSEL